jgi:hypothetical protein
MNNCFSCWFLRILLLWILIFKGLTARRLYRSFGVKGLSTKVQNHRRPGDRSLGDRSTALSVEVQLISKTYQMKDLNLSVYLIRDSE